MKFDSSKIVYGFFGACAVAGLTYLGVTKYYEKQLSFAEKNPQLISAYNDVEDNFYKSADEKTLEYDMIDGLIEGLDDRFTYYEPAKVSNEDYVNDCVMLRYNGFQIARDEVTKGILVTEVEKGSIAEKLGMSEDNLIVSIDGEIVGDLGYYKSIDLLLGKKDAPTELVCRHNDEYYSMSIERGKRPDDEEDENASDNVWFDDGVLYYRFYSFESYTAADFLNYSSQFDGLKGIVIDLRENSGGITETAVEFFDLFSGEGSVVKNVSSRTGEETAYKTTSDVKLKCPVTVLVSGDTLSSAEILTALFQSTGRGTVIGSQTGGKGVYQGSVTLDDMSSYALVEGYYYVNDVPNYHNVGLTPDIVIDMDEELRYTARDTQLAKALELLG